MGESPRTGTQRSQHWDAAYEMCGATGVSWFQPVATVSVELIERLGTPKDASLIDIGGGASLLVDTLIGRGFSDLTVLDVSKSALNAVRERLGPTNSVALLHEDLLDWKPERRFDLWHDRAVFHFLVEGDDREKYLRTLRSALRPGGAVVMATFALDGPEYCSGLPVARYSCADLAEILGSDFVIVEQLREEHFTPAGAIQPFTWMAARFVSLATSEHTP
jgi:SAM-dependent methyltransferase